MRKDLDKNALQPCALCPRASQTNKSAANKSQVPNKMLVKREQDRKMSPSHIVFYILCSKSIFLFQITFKLG